MTGCFIDAVRNGHGRESDKDGHSDEGKQSHRGDDERLPMLHMVKEGLPKERKETERHSDTTNGKVPSAHDS